MILHTGGTAFPATFTRSKSSEEAICIALEVGIMPSWVPSEPIRRTSLSLISPLIWMSLLLILKHLHKICLNHSLKKESYPTFLNSENLMGYGFFMRKNLSAVPTVLQPYELFLQTSCKFSSANHKTFDKSFKLFLGKKESCAANCSHNIYISCLAHDINPWPNAS